MIVYVIMFLLSIMLMHIATKAKKQKTKVLFYILSFLPFLLVSGFRYGLGTDYFGRYVYDYSRIYEGIEVKNLEIGFTLLMKGTMFFSEKPFLMFFITAFIISGCIFFAIAKESKDKVLSICVYFLLGFFFDSLNIMRQFLAISIIFIGFLFLIKRKKVFFVLCVLMASLFHSTALIMLVLAFLDYKMLFPCKLFLPCLSVVLALNTKMIDIFEFLLRNTRFNVYFSGKLFKGEISYLFILENLMFYLLMIHCYNKGYVRDKKAVLFINIQSLALLCMCLGSCHMLFIRVALYFSTIQILSVPYFLSKYQKTYAITIGNKTIRINVLKVLIICCMLVAIYRTNFQTNVNEVLPYRTIYTKHWLIY